MPWNWELNDWPEFSYRAEELEPLERQFLQRTGVLLGSIAHIEEQDVLKVELLTSEAYRTSEIEGEQLDRKSIQESIYQQLGLIVGDRKRVPPAESGIAAMMVDLYKHYAKPLTHDILFQWHRQIARGRDDLDHIGRYRSGDLPMQIVSDTTYEPTVHYEAPPSKRVKEEMDHFIDWFNTSTNLPILVRAGIAHLYFVSIHPFQDGNGRIARALAEKALSQSLQRPTLLLVSSVIAAKRMDYYTALGTTNKSNEITEWLMYFSKAILAAHDRTLRWVHFLIEKGKFYGKFGNLMNTRQEKVIARMFRAGPDGFIGGLSAENYIGITRCSRATASRDLTQLVEKGLLTRTGERRGTRYWLALPPLE